jgi:predicted dehydrogenase
MPKPVTRRHFIGNAGAAAGGLLSAMIVPRHVLGGPRNIPPSEKLNVAGVGVGGKGSEDLARLAHDNIVALCDVDLDYSAECIKRQTHYFPHGGKLFSRAKRYTDYRVMLDRQKDIDAVLIATPDHTHAVITLAAMRAGKHVYTQKPLTHSVYEARRLARAARECKVVTQMGIQGHSFEGIRLLSEWFQAGVLGEVREVDAWCSLSYYPWGHAGWSSKWSERPKETPPIPATLDWDVWIGPAAMRPYHRAYHPVSWRCWWDFGNGMMGDRGVHTFDPFYSALKLTAPTSIEATTCGNAAETHPLSSIVTFQFPARGALPPVKVTWYEGTRAPRPAELEDGRSMPNEGGFIVKGSKATVMAGVYGDNPRILPEAKMREIELPAKTLPRINVCHEEQWACACKGGRPSGAEFAYAGPLTEVCLLGNVAKRSDARLEWDAAAMKITNLPAANALLRTEYRKGWSL